MFRGFQRFQKFQKFRKFRNIRNIQNIQTLEKAAKNLFCAKHFCVSAERTNLAAGLHTLVRRGLLAAPHVRHMYLYI